MVCVLMVLCVVDVVFGGVFVGVFLVFWVLSALSEGCSAEGRSLEDSLTMGFL